jgi:hypothetical protein
MTTVGVWFVEAALGDSNGKMQQQRQRQRQRQMQQQMRGSFAALRMTTVGVVCRGSGSGDDAKIGNDNSRSLRDDKQKDRQRQGLAG